MKRKHKESNREYPKVSPSNELSNLVGVEEKKMRKHATVNTAKKTSNESNFHLQAHKLLKSTEIKRKYKTRLTSWIDNFQIFLNTLPIHEGIYISSLSREASNRPSRDLRFVKNIANHARNNLRCDQDISITFIRPECVGTFGLYKIDALPGPDIEMNIHMTIPKRCFKDKDFLNNRYFVKKFFYLMYLAEHLNSQNICSSIKCAYYNGNVLLPYLIVCPSSTERISIRLFLIPEQNYFKVTKFSPEINNINTQVFEQDIGIIENIEKLPTTYYNSALAFDASLAENHVFIEQIFSCSLSIREGLKLIVIWMNQRNLDTGMGAFSTELTIYFLVYLISQGMIDKNMTSYQVFTKFLFFIHTIDLTQKAISICEEISEEDLCTYKSYFDIVLMDKTGHYNTAAFLNINAYLKMKHECKLALDILDQWNIHSFSELFLTNITLYLQYDAILDVKNDNNYEFLLNTLDPKEKAKYIGNHTGLIIKILLDYLNKGFHKRVHNIVPIVPGTVEWNYGIRYRMTNRRLLFGIQLDPDFAFDNFECGIFSNNLEERNFKKFQSHNILSRVEVNLENNTIKGKRDIIKMISNYVMSETLHLNHKLYYNELEDFLVNGKVKTWYPSGTNEETVQKIINYSDDLEQKIKSLTIKPQITGIEVVSDVFCYTNVFPPIPTAYISEKELTYIKDELVHVAPKYVESIESLIKLAYSPKNMDKSSILQQMKNVFVQISELLKKQYHIVSSLNSSYLDVLHKGIVFRYYLYLPKELSSLKGTNFLQMQEKLHVVPKVVEALKSINTQYPSYGVSTCLAKRWIRAQLIDDFLLPDMVINLLNAYQYLHQSLYHAAVGSQEAFFRFLKFLIEMQWDQQPVVINFNNELSDEDIMKVEIKLQVDRKKFSALFILTPYDDGNSVFTKTAPCKEVLIRLKVLATEFLNLVENIILEESLYSWKELFIPNRRGFDCILNLQPLLNPRRHEQITRFEIDSILSFVEPKEENQHMPVINFNPVQLYLKELRAVYGDLCVFFHDTYGGNYIGVLWKPGTVEIEDIKKGFEILGKNILKSIIMKS
ncbi:nucleolar protein 6-like isoform X2 [Harmonia axyridis]|uniref:nucleolar protein 6-like isoform X2 n=1 Tax=Harmonia axyridis TaxID=115357 RepID=UPI001E277A5A|nr:nucleolar protein 6-like isoform X2 [Harmonia axyridis]